MEAKEAKEAKKSKGEGKKQSQADSLSASVSASAGSKTSSASGTPRTGVNDGGGGGGSKVTSAAETAKPTEPRQKLTFPDPVPVKASVWLRNSPQSATSKLTVDLQGQCIRQGDEVKFSLDTILSAEQSTEDVYQDSLYPLVQATFDGFDTCLFAFAQDGPTADKILHSESDGMLVQLFEDVFRMVKVNSGDGRQFLVELSYVLVGADKIYDLLCTKATKMGKAMMLKPSELDSGALMPESCVREAATSEDVLMDTYHRGKNFIHQLYETKPELRDLGSQSVLTISVECNEPVNGKDVFTKGSVRLVDCRASEINASQNLVALRSVIDAVGKKSKRVLWNASALPNMLRDAVGGGTLTRFLGVGDIPSLLGSSCFELLNAARRVMTRPVLKERLDMQLKKVKEEIEALKAKFKNTKAEAERARRLELEHEASTKKSALQQRLEQRKLQLQRNKEREDAEKARQAKLEEMRKNGTLKEPTIKYKIIEKEVVVEKEVEKEIIEKIVIGQRDEDIAEQKRLRQGATMTLEERNRLAMDAQQRDKEIAEAERKRAEAEQQFKALQMKVIGLASGSLIGEHEDGTVLDPTVIIARQQEQLRKAEYELKEQKKKEAKLRALQKRMKGAQDKVAQQIKAAKAEAEAHQKSQSAAKFKGKAALEEANRAIRKQRETQLAASKGLVEKHEKSVSDALLMETLVMQFLTRGELDQLRAISAGDECVAIRERRVALCAGRCFPVPAISNHLFCFVFLNNDTGLATGTGLFLRCLNL
eukprot:INCI4814.3.p1 GENE.INCI4814.3~~INCI4814.3.p1  ORF type:complete len:765 (-),score=167.58 INCI4814.3:2355-4649(-)